MKPKYFNNGRCRAVFDISGDYGMGLSMVYIELLVRHSFLGGFVWFYRWHEIGRFLFDPFTDDSEEMLFRGIDRVFAGRKEARRRKRRLIKMNTLKIIQA